MTETTPSFGDKQQNPAVKADGFVDYYELIHEEPDATITRLRSTINDLYNQAMANRDHRNLNKRRGYHEILDLLPEAREFLLNEDMRHQYNTYREEALDGIAKQSFEDWKAAALKKEGDEEGNAVLGVQEEQQRLRGQEVRAQVLKVSKEQQPKSRVTLDDTDQLSTAEASSSMKGSAACAIVFFVMLLITKVFLHKPLSTAILISGVLAIIVWVAFHYGKKGRTAV
ncbi:MAG: hypothetical protein ABI210_10375 [Abditibacteriaceae bacterium]